jgi:hypothetical protein
MILRVEFVEGSSKLYDVKPLMNEWHVFRDLRHNGLFGRVQVDAGGYGVSWNDYIDLADNGYASMGENV